jgi:integrase/recombinase XerD
MAQTQGAHLDAMRWISTFLDAQAAELGAATNTQLAYARDLKDFAGWCGGRNVTFDAVSQGDVEDYLIHCDAQGLAKSTRARRLSAIKQMFRFAFEEGWRSDNPAIQISGPGRDKRLPKTADVAHSRQGRQRAHGAAVAACP